MGSEVVDTATLLNLHAVQLHGSEGEEYFRSLRLELSPSCEVWTALSVGNEALASRGGDRMVFDNGEGGTGCTFDWSAVKDHPVLPLALVAGGIGPHNARAAAALGAYAIDIGSAVDERPGVKSPEKIKALFDTLRHVSREPVTACA